jgi:peptidoglycan hydrolase CwlO-like protein
MAKRIVILLFLLMLVFVPVMKIGAVDLNSYDAVTKELEDLKRTFNDIQKATEINEKQLDQLRSQLNSIIAKVDILEKEIVKKEKEVKEGEQVLIYQKKLLDERARSYYKNISKTSFSLIGLLVAENVSEAMQNFFYQKSLVDEDRKTIIKIVLYIKNLEDKKASLEQEKTKLASIKEEVDKQATFLSGEVTKAKQYQSELSSKIAELSSRQKELLAAKSGNFSVSVGNAAIADDPDASFSTWQSSAPGGSVTVFSFGAYAGNGPNYRRNGMSQYGAWKRAKEGKNYKEILREYYGAEPFKKDDLPSRIQTDQGELDFESEYLHGISEMPSGWTDNDSAALKAQAIAARTYAYRYMKDGRTICTNDNCQVFIKGKNDSSWNAAVDSTKGEILPDNVSAQYVSTPGGYVDTKGWDTSCGNQSCLVDGAYDRESPWFYKAWYTNYRYGSGFSICKRTNPWLSQEDFSDILNAWIVYNNGTDEDRSRILPNDGCGGGNPFSINEMRDRGGVNNISGVSVEQSTNGYTNNVKFNTNKGEISINGFDTGCAHVEGGCKDFWTIFNLRAPGNLSIKSRLYDVRIK